VTIRDALIDDAEELTELALRSKAHWGYDAGFMEACRPELTVSRDRVLEQTIRVVESDGTIIGFASIRGEGSTWELLDLFVEPEHIGRGVGRALWEDAVSIARRGQGLVLRIEADPNAEPWYRRRGAVRIGEVPSGSIPGRVLPLLEFELA
jgi:GNAT superfamily N-acetyltransferase